MLQGSLGAVGAVEGLADFCRGVPNPIVEHGCVRGPRQIKIAVADRLSEELVGSYINCGKADEMNGNGDGAQYDEWQ